MWNARLLFIIATTVVFKKGIETEIKADTMKFGLVGCLDYNISFKATPNKEFAIYFNAFVKRNKIEAVLEFLQSLLKVSKVVVHHGYEPPKVLVNQLYNMSTFFLNAWFLSFGP